MTVKFRIFFIAILIAGFSGLWAIRCGYDRLEKRIDPVESAGAAPGDNQ